MHLHIDDVLPFVSWLKGYRLRFLKPDIFAGLTVAVVAVPQSMAYAMIAGLPIEYGLYASIIPTIIGCLWGSSAQLITGPTTAVSLVLYSTLSRLAVPETQAYIELAFIMAFLVGAVQILLGTARLGALLNFVSHSVLLGFTAGAAVLIAFKQLPGLLGITIEKGGGFFTSLAEIIVEAPGAHAPTVLMGLTTVAVIIVLKRFAPSLPGTLIAMILVGTLTAVFDLDEKGVYVVGSIPRGLPPFHAPDYGGFSHIPQLASGALAIAILGLVEAASIARTIADQTRQRLNVNREFIGQGLANISASFFSGFAGSGSFTRSAVNYRSGAKTPLSGIIAGVAVALTILLAAPLAANLPLSALAGVLMVVAYDMVRKQDIVHAIRATRGDAAVLLVTFASTLALNIEFAIYVGVLLSVGLHLAAVSHPSIYSVTPNNENTKLIGSSFGHTCPQMEILNIEGSIFFGSATFVLTDLQQRLRNNPDAANLLVRMHRINTMDATGVHVLEIISEDLKAKGGGLYFSGVNHRVFEVAKNSGLLKDIGERHLRTTTRSAIRQAMNETFCPAACAVCEYMIFKECTELKAGHWEIFGEPAGNRACKLSLETGKLDGQPKAKERS